MKVNIGTLLILVFLALLFLIFYLKGEPQKNETIGEISNIQDDCLSWFDGCNDCSRDNNGIKCTLKDCKNNPYYKELFVCKQFKKDSPVISCQIDSDCIKISTSNCCTDVVINKKYKNEVDSIQMVCMLNCPIETKCVNKVCTLLNASAQ